MDPRRRSLPAHVTLAAVAAVGAVSAAGVSGFNAEVIVTAGFERAFLGEVERSRGVASVGTPARNSYDGLAGSESFWLGLSNAGVAKTLAVGQPLFLRAVAGHSSRRLIVTEVREHGVAAGPADPTQIDLGEQPGASSYLIIGRDAGDPSAGEFHIRVRDGQLSLVRAPEPQAL